MTIFINIFLFQELNLIINKKYINLCRIFKNFIMKKVFILFVAVSALAVASCGGKKDDKKGETTTSAPAGSSDASPEASPEQ